MSLLISNVGVYRAIAEEAYSEVQSLSSQERKPKSDGSDGYVITFDPTRRSFKQSLIAIAFSAIYFEALLFLVGTRVMGKKWKTQMDCKTYEEKLSALGVTEVDLIDAAKRLRKSRRDLVHEKAVPVEELPMTEVRHANREAAQSVSFIARITERLKRAA